MEPYKFSQNPWFIGAPERILGKEPTLPVETAYFRIVFTLEGKAELRAAVSASSRYCLSVNGVPVTHGPCKGDRMRHYCDELDLGGLLHEGQNLIACKVVSFPPQEASGGGKDASYANRGPFSVVGTASGPCFLFCGEAVDEGGGKTELSTGYAPWLVRNDTAVSWLHPPYTMVFCHEEVEAGKIPPLWDSSPDSAAGFVPAINRWKIGTEGEYGEIPPLPLFGRPIPLLEEKERELVREVPVELPEKRRLSFRDAEDKSGPVTMEGGQSYYVDLDAGELTTGYVSLETQDGAGAEIVLTYAESYGGPFTGRIRGDRLDYQNFALDGFKDVYRPAGERGEREKYEFFWFRTFRILRIEVKTADAPLTLWPLKYRETGYPLEVKTEITPPVNNEKENGWVPALWDISLRTLRRCMHETYEDCPYYEQMQYTFDTRLQMLFHYYLNGDTRLGLKTIDDFHRSILPEGIIQSRYPTNSPQVIPTFAISWLSMLLDYYNQTADRSVLERYRPTAEEIILWFKRKKNAQGLIESLGYWNFIDWTPEWREIHGSVRAAFHGPSTIQNLMYIYGLRLLGKILDILGFPEMRNYYRAEAGKTSALVLAHCWDEKRGLFREGPAYNAEYTQHAQVWAVLSGVVGGNGAAALMQKTLNEPGLLKCTFPLQFYLFRALEEAGLYEKTAPLWEDWKRFLSLNLSTLPETPYDNSRSDCHAWSSLLLYEYPAKILGVYPREPGYERIGIRPQGLYMGSAGGRVHTPRGTVEAAWEYRGGVFSIRGRIPPEGKALLILPDSSSHTLGEGDFVREISFSLRG